MDVPIACTLDADQAGAQLAQWRVVLGRAVVHAARPKPTTLRLLLRNTDHMPELTGLAQREKACCAFFDFTFEIEADAVTLVVRVPEDAQPILDDFATLCR